ncbi:MAG: MBL fold metallo-hydrolase [Candidatus Hinthialibacter antarcticus]|nr:MBL fold metallo-hydrolase [Candidatus Hinthialibacter antarcticus]
MKIKYIGHSCFLLTSSDEVSIIIDPYKPGAYGGAICYSPIVDRADIAVLSREHEDHANVKDLIDQPLSVRADSRVRGVEFDMVDTFHDDCEGQDRGPNRVICFTMDELRVCHLGDLGHVLTPEQIEKIGPVDILFVPVGGRFTIGPAEADQIVEQLQPSIITPMHFKTDKCLFPIEPVESFLDGKNEVRRSNSSEVVVQKSDLPETRTYLYIPPSN